MTKFANNRIVVGQASKRRHLSNLYRSVGAQAVFVVARKCVMISVLSCCTAMNNTTLHSLLAMCIQFHKLNSANALVLTKTVYMWYNCVPTLAFGTLNPDHHP